MPVHRYAGAYQYVETTPVAPSTLLTGLGAYWPMNETSDGSAPVTRLDQLGVSDLTDNNTCPSAAGILALSTSFDGANSETLSAAHNANIDTGDIDFSLSCWGLLTNKLATQGLWIKFDTGAGDSEYSIFYDAGADRITFRMFGAPFVDVVANTFGSPPTNTFFHMLCWVEKDPVNTVNIKINGGATDSVPKNFNNFPVSVLGPVIFGGIATVYLTGRVDEAGFWRRKLTAPEMVALYGGGVGLAYPF